jgi:hypothetical protein
MFYRVVIQGRTMKGADMDEVKRQFVRVTGLPVRAAEQILGGMPKVIKRKLPQPDAERIAATLRAIGAAATVEREQAGSEGETDEGFEVIATPLNSGPPTVVPGAVTLPGNTPVAPRHRRLLRAVLAKVPHIVGGILLVGGAVLVAPVVDDFVADMRRAPASAPVAPAQAGPAEAVQTVQVLNANFLHGPWRCTDQRTGASTFWTYEPTGALTFHGDVFSERPARTSTDTPAQPVGWTLEGQRILHTLAEGASNAYTVGELTLSRFRYADSKLEIQCRRP